eukprot:g336.t1
MVSYIVLAIPALYLIHMYKLKWALVVGSSLNTLGCIVRVCGNLFVGQGQGGFAFAFIGAAVCSCAQLFTLAIPPSLSMTWFPASERALATGVGVFANQIGTALGLGFTSQVVKSDMGSSLTIYLGAQMIMSLVSFVLILLFAKDRPEDAPSASAEVSFEQRDNDEYYGDDEIKTFRSFLSRSIFAPLRESRDLVLLTLAYGISTGVFYTLATDLSQILKDSKSTESSSELGLAIVLAGTVGTLVCGYVLDRTRAYRYLTRSLFIVSTIELALFTVVLAHYETQRVSLMIVSCVFGFTITGIISVGFELAVELTFPLDEAICSGILNISAQVFGSVLIWISDLLLDGFIVPGGTKSSSNLTNIALVVFMTLATFLIFFEDGKLNRMNVEFYRRYLGLDGEEEEKTEEKSEEGDGATTT